MSKQLHIKSIRDFVQKSPLILGTCGGGRARCSAVSPSRSSRTFLVLVRSLYARLAPHQAGARSLAIKRLYGVPSSTLTCESSTLLRLAGCVFGDIAFQVRKVEGGFPVLFVVRDGLRNQITWIWTGTPCVWRNDTQDQQSRGLHVSGEIARSLCQKGRCGPPHYCKLLWTRWSLCSNSRTSGKVTAACPP